MAQVDRQVNLVGLRDLKDRLLILHVHRNQLVADLRGMLSVVHEAELLVGDVPLEVGLVLQLDALRLDFLAPAVFVEALPEEDDVGQHNPVVLLVDSVADSVEVQSEDLVDQHLLTVLIVQQVVVALPLLLVGLLVQLVRLVVQLEVLTLSDVAHLTETVVSNLALPICDRLLPRLGLPITQLLVLATFVLSRVTVIAILLVWVLRAHVADHLPDDRVVGH